MELILNFISKSAPYLFKKVFANHPAILSEIAGSFYRVRNISYFNSLEFCNAKILQKQLQVYIFVSFFTLLNKKLSISKNFYLQ